MMWNLSLSVLTMALTHLKALRWVQGSSKEPAEEPLHTKMPGSSDPAGTPAANIRVESADNMAVVEVYQRFASTGAQALQDSLD